MTRYNNTVAINQNLSARLCLKKAFRELQIAEMIFQTHSRPMIDMEYKKRTTITVVLTIQGMRDSNPHRRFWRPVLYH